MLSRVAHDPRWQNIGLALVMLATGLLLLAVSERIPVGNGLGFDGAEYGSWAMHFDDVLAGRIPLTAYRTMRLLPSALAYGVLHLLGAAMTPQNVIRFFEAFNLLLLCLAAFTWGRVADLAGLDRQGKWFGFLALFANHAVLKFNFYYPVLTDVSGYACAVFVLWAYLADRPVILLTVLAAGAFCWPTLPVYAGIALLFPRRDQTPGRPCPTCGCIAGLLAAAGYGLLAVRPLTAVAPFYPLAVAVVMAYLGLAAFALFASPYRVGPMLRRAVSPVRLVGLAVAVAALFLARSWLGTHMAQAHSSGFNLPLSQMLWQYLRTTCIPLSTRFPGEFLVAHTLYFGPAFFFLALFPRRAAAAAGRFGLGFLLLVGVAVGHAIMPLSRQWLAGWPVLVLVLASALRGLPLSRGFWVCFTLLSLFVSKVWLLFNVSPLPGADGRSLDWVPRFSFELYVSSTGRWMSFPWYLSQAALLGVFFLCFLWYFHQKERTPASR